MRDSDFTPLFIALLLISNVLVSTYMQIDRHMHSYRHTRRHTDGQTPLKAIMLR